MRALAWMRRFVAIFGSVLSGASPVLLGRVFGGYSVFSLGVKNTEFGYSIGFYERDDQRTLGSARRRPNVFAQRVGSYSGAQRFMHLYSLRRFVAITLRPQ